MSWAILLGLSFGAHVLAFLLECGIPGCHRGEVSLGPQSGLMNVIPAQGWSFLPASYPDISPYYCQSFLPASGSRIVS